MRMDWVPWTYILALDFSECFAEDEGLKIMLEVRSHQAWGNVEYPLFLFSRQGRLSCAGRATQKRATIRAITSLTNVSWRAL